MLRILIADDHEIVRKGLKLILLEEFSFAYIEEAGDTKTLVNKALGDEWDIVISDLVMPGSINGIEALRQIKKKSPKLPVLILSMHSEEQYAIRALKAGASGYLSKDMAQDELINAVRRILAGKKYITPMLAEKISSYANDTSNKALHELLSDRELNVMKLLASGKSITEIAETLSLGVTTISTYRSRILEKMNLNSNADLTRYALENNLI